jgi:hypothetical protein
MFSREQMIEELNRGVCIVNFTKADGSDRTMNCTLNSSFLTEAIGTGFIKEENEEQNKTPNPDVIPVWDIDVNGWRSFRIDTVSSFSSSSFLAG